MLPLHLSFEYALACIEAMLNDRHVQGVNVGNGDPTSDLPKLLKTFSLQCLTIDAETQMQLRQGWWQTW